MFDAIFNFNLHERDRFVSAFAASVPKGARVLDAGAGPCRYKRFFALCEYRAQDFAGYTGAEHSYGALDYVCDIANIPVPDDSFDCVICTEVLEHLLEPEQAVREFARILKPGGRLLLTAPLLSAIHMAPYHYFSGFTPFWYQQILPRYGFRVDSCEPNGGFFKFYGQESRRFLHLLTPRARAARVLFFPLKALLAIWFRLIVPVACHFLDRYAGEGDFTVGYHVLATLASRESSPGSVAARVKETERILG